MATDAVIEAVAITHVQPLAGAVRPDRVLNVTREVFRKSRVELTGIDGLAQNPKHRGAAHWSVTLEPVGMAGARPIEDAGADQKVMDQPIDCDQRDADLAP